MKHWVPFTSGFFAFIAAHLIETAKWSEWFRGEYRPWFLNSGRAMVFTSVWLVVVSAIVTRRSGRYLAPAFTIATGAVVAMVIVFFVGGDPGTIFPIVLAAGGALIAMVTFAGALAARVL